MSWNYAALGRLFIKQGLNKKINEKKCKVFKSVISKNPVKKKNTHYSERDGLFQTV